MRAFPLPPNARVPVLNQLPSVGRQTAGPCKLLEPLYSSALRCRGLHETAFLTQSRSPPASSASPKTSSSAAPKPLPYKSTKTVNISKSQAFSAQEADAKSSKKNAPKPEFPTLNSAKAWNSFVTNVSSGRGDSEVGRKAAAEVVRTGKLPEKYKPASRR